MGEKVVGVLVGFNVEEVGKREGFKVEGAIEGELVGGFVGISVGSKVGEIVGTVEGLEGINEGKRVDLDGSAVSYNG